MQVTFIGATHEVTGSCTLIETEGKYILIDCGMEQGPDMFENESLPVMPEYIDCVLLTHAHIDHSGKIPLLYKYGFRGKVYTTEETCRLSRIMLLDSAHIQESDAERATRKSARSGGSVVEPLYTVADVEALLPSFVPSSYGQTRQILENVSIRFSDVGHLLGSSAIEIWITEQDTTKKIVFSGDVGNLNQPIIRDPSYIDETDYLVLESTYGNRLHETSDPGVPPVEYLAQVINRTFSRGGNVVIPSFAVGRTQEILYFLREIKNRGLVPNFPNFPVYLDSPLGIEATGIFMQCNHECLDEEALALVKEGINPLHFEGLHITETADESRAINFNPASKVIIASSGMCDAGRIRHHLKHNLWRQESLVLFTGYQAAGTLGRILYDGAREVRLFGETIVVNAEIDMLRSISGHADQKGLLSWLDGFSQKPVRIFVNHGDDAACTALVQKIQDTFGIPAIAPYSGTTYDLLTDSPVMLTRGTPVKKAHRPKKQVRERFARLLSAADRLRELARSSEGMANRDISRFADDIERLIQKWL
ncbi:MAG: MBL fold metallo-hydrolase [Clostridia bacterium]|nr:MBL fold metallo-hydrolase [Clostridia bacterium]